MLTKLDRLRIGQCENPITFWSRNRSLWKYCCLAKDWLVSNCAAIAKYRQLGLPVFCSTTFLGGQIQSSGSSEYPHPLQVLCRIAGSGCGLLFSGSCSVESVTTVGHYRMFDASSKWSQKNWLLLWHVIAFLFTWLIKGILSRDKYIF